MEIKLVEKKLVDEKGREYKPTEVIKMLLNGEIKRLDNAVKWFVVCNVK